MTKHKLIFLVDDDWQLLPAYKRHFDREVKKADWGTMTPPSVGIYDCTSGQAALDLMRTGLELETSSLGTRLEYFIVSDGNMPSMNGDQFIRQARELLGERVKMAFLVTGRMHEFEGGAESIGYTLLQKPLLMTQLTDPLRTFLLSDAPT